MSKTNLGIATALALICLLLPASLAQANYDPIGSGTTKLTLDKGFLAQMRKQGVKVTAIAPAKLKNTTFTFALITRRSRFRGGTRYLSRGIDEQGHVSNYNETEQIALLKKEEHG